VQALGACGLIYLAKLNDDGTTTPVSVPEVDERKSVEVIGVDGASLDLKARAACGDGQTLLRYDPKANTSTVLLGAPINGGGVIDAISYVGQR
jgi:TolB protein